MNRLPPADDRLPFAQGTGTDRPRSIPFGLGVRRAFSVAIQAALRVRSSPLQLGKSLGVLVVAPHPDDETFGCGGTLALLSRAGARLNVAFLTDGRASHPGHPAVTPAQLATLREAEARAATGLLGIDGGSLVFLNVADGTLRSLDPALRKEVVDAIVRLLNRFRPQFVLAPCRSDGSSEHDAAYLIVASAVEQSGLTLRVLEYPVWSWWSPRLLLSHLSTYRKVWRTSIDGVRSLKGQAIAQYVSQVSPLPPDDAAVLPAGFPSMFLCRSEYLFEK